jgi:hypothetical protein
MQRSPDGRVPLAAQSSAPSSAKGNSWSVSHHRRRRLSSGRALGREAVPLLGVQVRPNLEGRARFEMRAQSAEASPHQPSPLPHSRLGGLSNAG